VRSVVDENGQRLNYYEYDPFGKITRRDETIPNIFQYLGSLGIVKLDEFIDLYYMRDRVYDASHGRFISIDPLGELRCPV
jgi:RHS repeat-associated protein